MAFSDRDAKYRAGAQQVSAAQASELMSAPQSVNELDRLVVVAAVIDGWMDRLRDPAVAKATLAAPARARAARGRGRAPRPSARHGAGRVDRDRGRRAVRRAGPGARRRSSGGRSRTPQLGDRGRRPRVEILNGTGALGRRAGGGDQGRAAGGRVVLTDNLPRFRAATRPRSSTTTTRWRAAAQGILDAMGCGSLRKAGQDVRIADVTILVGFGLSGLRGTGRWHLNAHEMATVAARVADDKLATDVVVLDVGDIIGITEAFVLASGYEHASGPHDL